MKKDIKKFSRHCMSEITIHIDKERSNFVLRDCSERLTNNKRVKISLKRIGISSCWR